MYVCRYEVLGGLHTFLSKSQLIQIYPENTFYKNCMAEVYVGLNDEEALRVSKRHNVTSHFNHNVTHRDLVSIYGHNSNSLMDILDSCITKFQ